MRDRRKTTAALLRAELDGRHLSIRALSRLIAGSDEQRDVEDWRRKLNRYLRGGDPSPESAEVMERRLEKPAGYFPRYQPRRKDAALPEPQPRTPPIATRRLENSIRSLEEKVRNLELLRAEDVETLDANARSIDVLERRVDRLELRLPHEERGHA